MNAIEEERLASPAAGLRIDEKYELTQALGEGGMSTVWRARHISLGHAVAIKFLQGAGTGKDARARFEREARIAARLGESSRHIARVIDHGVYQDAIPFLVMELLLGETLGARLKQQGRLPLSEVTELTAQLCRALHAAHSAGVIHRDVKPSNIFLCSPEHDEGVLLKLMDFGVAKAAPESEEDPSTRAGTAIGTPSYMSPEQILAKTVDTRSDLWGVAAVVYRMATGRSPFGHGTIDELGLRILSTEPPPPSAIAPDLPRSFDAWVVKALAKSPDARFQTARDLADALAVATRSARPLDNLRTPAPFAAPSRSSTGSSVSAVVTPLESQAPTRREIPLSLTARSSPKRSAMPLIVLAAIVLPIGVATAIALRPRVVEATNASPARDAPANAASDDGAREGRVVAASASPTASVASPPPLASVASSTESPRPVEAARVETPPPERAPEHVAPRASAAPSSSSLGTSPKPKSSETQSEADRLWKRKDEY